MHGHSTFHIQMRSPALGVFEFVVLLVLISTAGKVLSRRAERIERPSEAPQLLPGEVERIREAVEELNGRVVRLEEERDFYKALLDSPERQRELPSAGGSAEG
jgi:hypothetical protein